MLLSQTTVYNNCSVINILARINQDGKRLQLLIIPKPRKTEN